MPNKPLTHDECYNACVAVARKAAEGFPLDAQKGVAGALYAASVELGVAKSTLAHKVRAARDRFGITPQTIILDRPEIEEVQDRPDPLEILDRHTPQNTEYLAKKPSKPRVIHVAAFPFAVAFVGDPHLSNKGCNLAALRKDIETLASYGVRAIQMGDVLDNFHRIPKLAANEAQNRMSIAEAQSLAQWLIAECGVKWDAHILGNHDEWLEAEGVTLFKQWAKRTKVYHWNARIIYKWDGGHHYVYAAHDHKGHSQFNPTHGPGKAALFDGEPDTYVAAHRHHHAEAKVPNAYRGKTYQLVRVRGYKDRDSYSEGRPQFAPHDMMEGRSALLVVNPLSETHDGQKRVFMDLQDGLEFLETLKRRYA